MGLEEPALYDDDLTLARTLIESGHPTLEGVTVERLRREGWVRLGHPHPLVPFAVGLPDAVGQARAVLRARGRRRPRPAAGLHAARRGRRRPAATGSR